MENEKSMQPSQYSMILSFNLHSFLRTKQDPCNQSKEKVVS